MNDIPAESGFDHSLAFLSEGYRFVGNRADRFGSDIFRTHLLGRGFTCVRGPEAAEMFYVPGRFTRRGALPTSVLHLLQDEGSVATLDGGAHRHRKAMFLQALNRERSGALAELAGDGLDAALAVHGGGPPVIMHDLFARVLATVACGWAGIPLDGGEVAVLAGDAAAMIGHAGSIGPGNWLARLRRHRAERLMRRAVARLRGQSEISGPAAIIALHRDEAGQLLAKEIAAVELLNIVRPIVAVARYMTFAMLALHERPAIRDRLSDDAALRTAFVQEVRRFYPFFPVVAGRVLQAFQWGGHRFVPGELVMLDLYGTCHDARAWAEPDCFRPERFLGWRGDPFTLIPQGGGDHLQNHRCAGEWATIGIMEAMVAVLARSDWHLPQQDLSIDLGKMPALPASGVRAVIG